MSDSSVTQKNQNVYINGRKAAVLRNYGTLADIRRRSNGFLYSGGMKAAISEQLLEMLPDTGLLQFTNMDTKDTWTITVHDFRRYCEPVRYAGFEPQRACEVSRMVHSGGKKRRKNEPIHIEYEPTQPAPQIEQMRFI